MFEILPQYPPAFWFCAVASVLLIGISKAGFGAGIGVIAMPLLALAFVVFQLGIARLMGVIVKRKRAVGEGLFWGVLSGFTSTLAHVGSPPVMVYLLPQKLPRDIYVGTAIYFFAVTNIVKLIPYARLKRLHAGNMMVVLLLLLLLLLLPVVFVGVWLGYRLNEWCSDTWFNRLVYTLLFLTGVQLVLGIDVIHLFSG